MLNPTEASQRRSTESHEVSARDAAPRSWPAYLRGLLGLASFAQTAPLYLFLRQMSGNEQGLFATSALALALALLGAWGAWKGRRWTGWTVLSSASWTATTGFFGVSALGEPAWWSAVLLGALVLVLGVLAPAPRLARVGWPVRAFCFAVVALTRYVAFWGLFFPTGLHDGHAGFDDALPFLPAVPTLHARFIGALYLGATVICVWHVFARSWAVARLLQALIFLWTFLLLVVTVLHLDVFDWKASSVWLWFVAYLAFPAVSLWIWRRVELEPDHGALALPTWGRTYLHAQGASLLLLASLGLLAVPLLVRIWPWKLPELLGHVYSAPFAAFGIGSVLAAGARGAQQRAVIPFCAATFTMAIGSLAASLIHRDKFASGATSTWSWFAALGIVALASAALAVQLLTRFRSARAIGAQDP